MASEREQVLVNVFLAIAGEGWQGVLAELLGLPLAEQGAGGVMPATRAVSRAAAQGQTKTTSSANSAESGDKGSTLGKVLSYTSLGTAPLIKGLIGLFTGGDDREPEPVLTQFVLPPRVAFEAAMGNGGLEGADYDQFGMPRTRRVSRTARAGGNDAAPGREPPGSSASETGGRDIPERSAPQVTVQVQAMDSRSFLDHSDEIARAVREAMLNMHSLNDVVSDL